MKKYALLVALIFLMVAGFMTDKSHAFPDGPDDNGGPPRRQGLENVRERIETMRMWKLTKALDLDEKTSAKVFPLLNRYDKERAVLEVGLRKDMKEMREDLKNNRTGELRPLLDGLDRNHKSLQKINDEEWTELKKVLTVEQQAGYIIFRMDFEREMRQAIAESRERRGERPGKERPERPMPPERP